MEMSDIVVTVDIGDAEKQAAERDVKDVSSKTVPTWREFTQNTTFHGIRYVFDDTSWIRK